MAIHSMFKLSQVNVPGLVTLFGRAVGAATSNMTGLVGLGITSITRSDVGIHTVVFDKKYAGLLHAKFQVIDTGTIDDWSVTLDTDLTNGNTVVINVFKGGTAADLPTTATLLMEFNLQDSSVKPDGI